MEYRIKKGDMFKCIKSFKMDDGQVAYTKGESYFSALDNNITDNESDVYHNMAGLEDFFEHFKLIKLGI